MEPVKCCVEEAIAILGTRDAVYFDPGASAWVCTIPSKAPIRTYFGEVQCMLMRSYDGTLICSHPNGVAYFSWVNVTQDEEGNYVDRSFIPPSDNTTNDSDEDDAQNDPSASHRKSKTIDLRGCLVDHNDMTRLCRNLTGNCFITLLSLSGNHLQDNDIALLADALVHNGCLQELNLSYNIISALGSTLLATALIDNKHVGILDLTHNRISKDGVHPWLGRTLRMNHALKQLKLNHNDIGDHKAVELVASLAPKVASMEQQIKSQLAARRRTAMPMSIAKATPSITPGGAVNTNTPEDIFNTTLTTLLLGNTGISDEAALHLAHVLAKNHTLRHLDISSNTFTHLGNRHIAQGIQHNTSLRVLNYSDNRIDEADAVILLQALRHHNHIETVLFQDCLSGSVVGSELARLTRATKTLKTLDLSHCALEPPGVIDFYKSLGENSTIQHMEMTCMGLKSDTAVGILASAVERNTTLCFLNLSYNELTLRGCKLLRDAAATHGARIFLSLEGNSGEKRPMGVTITGGSIRPARQY